MNLEYNRDTKKPLYISTEVMRWLWLIAKAMQTTPDEIADGYLRGSIKNTLPQVIEHQKKIDKLEKEIIESLKQ